MTTQCPSRFSTLEKLVFRLKAQHPIFAHAPNLSFHSCLYFSHHSSSHVWRVSPQTMVLNRACSSAVQATPSNSPFVTGAWLRSFPAAASSGSTRASSAKVRMAMGKEVTSVRVQEARDSD